MKVLNDIARQFKVSQPVFVAQLSNDGKDIEFELKSPYKPNPDDFEDPLTKLVAKHFDERFEANQRRFVNRTNTQQVFYEIMDEIKNFYTEHAALKNPKQSKLWLWLRHMDNQYNHPASEGFISLWKYVEADGGIYSCQHATVQNVLAILDLMKGKYESHN